MKCVLTLLASLRKNISYNVSNHVGQLNQFKFKPLYNVILRHFNDIAQT